MFGKFITLEGIDGVGKTSNIKFIQNILDKQQIKYLVTREPGGTQLGEEIRELLLKLRDEAFDCQAELLMMFAARSQHLNNVIHPALNKNNWVICDRFTDSTYAYQGYGKKLGRKPVEQLEQLVQRGFVPNLTLLFDAPIEVAMSRFSSELDRFEAEQLSFFNKAREGYLEQARLYPKRIKTINANQPLVDVQYEIKLALEALIKLWSQNLS